MYVVQFDAPEGTIYAGKMKDGLGFAPTMDTALLFGDEDEAERIRLNGYGNFGKDYGRVARAKNTEAS